MAIEKLFQPMRLGGVEIGNRLAMAPMGIMGLATAEGGFSRRAMNYYVERAKGGIGLIITSVAKIENEIERFNMPSFPCVTLNPMHFIGTSAELTERVHAYGTKIFLQLAVGFGRVAAPGLLAGKPVASSAIPYYWDPAMTCRELTTGEVEVLVKKAGDSAAIAAEAGFDGVEIHAVHEGYLLDQFAMALCNRRNDKYGGELRDRLRFPVEILQEIRRQVGGIFPVVLRYSIKSYIKDWNQGGLPGEDFHEQGRDVQEGLQAAQLLEKAGYDAFDADAGSYDAWYWAHPPIYQEHGCYLPLTEKLKQVVSVPVLVAGRLDDPELARQVINEGVAADMIVLGRGLLADPHWPAKLIRGEEDRVRPCIGCQDGCLGRIAMGKPLSCAVNPACGREEEYEITKTTTPRMIAVVGGGVAGMEAARVAASRGHRVRLLERCGALGGHLVPGSVPAFKNDIGRLLSWYKNELSELKVDIHLDIDVTADMVLDAGVDAVVIATGSVPAIPDIQGEGGKTIITAIDALLGHVSMGNHVLMVGGGLVDCEVALWLVEQGKTVIMAEARSDFMAADHSICHANRTMLLDLLRHNNITMLVNTRLEGIHEDHVALVDGGFNRKDLSVDTIVMGTGFKPNRALYEALLGRMPEIYLVGDARHPHNIMHAIWDAYEVCRKI